MTNQKLISEARHLALHADETATVPRLLLGALADALEAAEAERA